VDEAGARPQQRYYSGERGLLEAPGGVEVRLWEKDPARSAAHVKRILAKHGDNHTRAAAALGVSYRTLCRWLVKYKKLLGAHPGKPGRPKEQA
jgi:hypothetical protein